MNRIIEFFARQGVFADILLVSIVGTGILSVLNLKREVFPHVQFDVVSIGTIFPGASPEEVEKLITNKIEQELKEVDGIKRMTSVSTEGRSQVVIQLDPDETNQDKGKADIQDIVDRITDLPADAEEPIVTAIESKLQPIVEVGLYGDVPEMELRAAAKRIERELEEIREVARVVIPNVRDVEYQVEADPAKLSQYRISLQEIINALKTQNVSIPGGTIKVTGQNSDGIEKIVRTVGEFSSAEEIGDTVIRANDLGTSIRVKDVAKVSLSLARATIIDQTNGKPSLRMTVLKKSRADAIDLVDNVKAKIAAIKSTLDPRLDVEYVNDVSYFIRRRLNILTSNLLVGLVLVLFVLSLILPIRVAVLVSLGIPFAFLGTLTLFDIGNYTINLISLIGMIIVVGMLVDDAIVVTENSVRLMEEGHDPKTAAIKGAQQVWAPVMASVATTMMSFTPLLMMTGIFGKFVKEMPLAVIFALTISLVEAFLILPYHISRWVRIQKRSEKVAGNPLERVLAVTERLWDHKVVPLYTRTLEKMLRRRYLVAVGMFFLFAVSLYVATTHMKLVLFPGDGIEIFLVKTDAPVGTRLERNRELIRPIEQAIAKLPKSELLNFTTDIGIQRQDLFDPNTQRGGEYGIIKVYLTPERDRDRTAQEITDSLRAQVGDAKSLGLRRVSFERVNPGPPVGKPINIGVQGETYEEILPAANALKAMLAKVKGVTDLQDSYLFGKREVRVRLKPSEAAAAGLNVSSVGMTIRAAYEGIEATSISRLDEDVVVRVQLPDRAQTNPATLNTLLIPNPRQDLVPLGRVAKFEEVQSISNFQHENNKRQVRVTGDVNTDITSSIEVNRLIRDEFVPLIKKDHPGVFYAFGGEEEDTKESMESLGKALVFAIAGIFMILILTFKQILQPLLVILTVFMGFIAVVWSFFFHGLPLSFMGMMGIVALAGVIVNNAIVFVDFVNQARAGGMGRWDSIMAAGQKRIRPIFLTTATTVAGILPTAYGIGGKDPFVVPIAMSLGWGMAFGSLLTTLAFPAALAILDDIYIYFRGEKALMARAAEAGAHGAQEEPAPLPAR